jgi:hypothetical protein
VGLFSSYAVRAQNVTVISLEAAFFCNEHHLGFLFSTLSTCRELQLFTLGYVDDAGHDGWLELPSIADRSM